MMADKGLNSMAADSIILELRVGFACQLLFIKMRSRTQPAIRAVVKVIEFVSKPAADCLSSVAGDGGSFDRTLDRAAFPALVPLKELASIA